MISKIINLYKNYTNIFFYIFLLLNVIILFLSLQYKSYISFFWPDHTYVDYVHNLSLKKSILEVINEPNNINGITLTILNPYLNPLSFLNYKLDSLLDYKIYLTTFYFFELLVILLHLKFFIKKISLENYSLILFLFIVYLTFTTGFDHQSYINFPILVFCFFHGIGLFYQDKKIKFFIFLLIGNIWSFLINPIYFFSTCFAPLIFYYYFFIFKKKYKNFFLILLANLFCAIPFVLISLGSARIGAGDLYPASFSNYNFTIFVTKKFLILNIILIFFSLRLQFQKRELFYSSFLIIFSLLTIIFGLLYKYKYNLWKIPQPLYLEYSFQYLYISIVFMIIYHSKKDFIFKSLLSVFILVFFYNFYSFFNSYNKLTNHHIPTELNDNGYQKKFFWDKPNKEFFLKKDLQNKRVLISLPSFDSDLYATSFINQASFAHVRWENIKYLYNNSFGGSLSFVFFWMNDIIINEGHSQYLDISTALSNKENFNIKYNDNFSLDSKSKIKTPLNFNGNKYIERQSVPSISNYSTLIDLYDIEYILSDKILNFEIIKQFDFEKFKIYIYKTNSKKMNNNIFKINFINNVKNYEKNLSKINEELFLLKDKYTKNLNVKKFCEVKQVDNKYNKTIFTIKTKNEYCMAVFPIPFSYNNNFIHKENLSNQKCKTLRVQFFFHGCVFSEDAKIQLKKNNIIRYPFGSMRDFLEMKKII